MTTRRASDSATRFKFTAIGLKQLKHDGQRAAYTDAGCAGLSYRVTASNARSFSFSYRRPNGQKTRETFGDIPLAEAHALAADLRKRLRAGEDPAGSRLQRRQEDRTGSRTFGALAAQYLEIHAVPNLRAASVRIDRQNLNKHVLPRWGDRRFDQITRRDVIALLDEINKKRPATHKFKKGRYDGGPSAADHVRAMLKTIFNFAIRRDDLAHNPVLLIGRYNKNVRPGRPLTDAEARLLYAIVTQAKGVKPDAALGLQLLLLTGCRRSEIAHLCRDELHDLDDPQQARIELPPARTKKNKWLVLPLSPAAVAVVKEALALSRHEAFLFHHTRGDNAWRPLFLNSGLAAFIQSLQGDDPVVRTLRDDPPRIHDLRHTVGTGLGRIGYEDRQIGRILNHGAEGVTGKVYNKYDYAKEKRAMLNEWAAHLVAPPEPSNVVPMRERSRRAAANR